MFQQLHRALPVLLLTACEMQNAPTEPEYTEPWPHEHEALFQEAEALKYTLEQQRLEAERLRAFDLPDSPDTPTHQQNDPD